MIPEGNPLLHVAAVDLIHAQRRLHVVTKAGGGGGGGCMKGDCGVSAFFAIYGRRAGGGRQFPARLRASEINAHTGGRRGQKKAYTFGGVCFFFEPLDQAYRL